MVQMLSAAKERGFYCTVLTRGKVKEPAAGCWEEVKRVFDLASNRCFHDGTGVLAERQLEELSMLKAGKWLHLQGRQSSKALSSLFTFLVPERKSLSDPPGVQGGPSHCCHVCILLTGVGVQCVINTQTHQRYPYTYACFIYIYLCACVCVCMYVCMYACVCVYIYTHILRQKYWCPLMPIHIPTHLCWQTVTFPVAEGNWITAQWRDWWKR